MFVSLGWEPRRRVFLEERQQFRWFYVFRVRVCPWSDDPKDILHGQDCQCVCHRCTRDGGDEKMTSGLQRKGLGQMTKAWAYEMREKRNEKLAFKSCAHTCRNSEGALTCSKTSIEHTTSYCFPSASNASAVVCRYVKDLVDPRANCGSRAA